MLAVDIVRSLAVAAFPSGSIVLNLSSGSFFQLEAGSTRAVLDIARDLPTAEIEERMTDERKIPRYVARERVRALQLQLQSPFALACNVRLGSEALLQVGGHVLISEAPGLLRPGEAPQLRGSTLRSQEGVLYLAGDTGEGTAPLRQSLQQGGFSLLEEHSVAFTIDKGKITLPLANMWFVEPKRRPGTGLVLARRNAPFAMRQLLSHVSTSHPRGAWVELFKAFAALCEHLPTYQVSIPDDAPSIELAVREFASARAAASAS